MNKIDFRGLSKGYSTFVKGIAITLIVFHNYLHLTNHIGENEFLFYQERINILFLTISNSPSISINALFSYFGHFGVQAFIIISGYGLSKKLLNSPKKFRYKSYIFHRFLNVYSLLLFGILMLFILLTKENANATFLKEAAWKLTMIDNFNFNTLFRLQGPWWFFSLILQLYIIFPLIFLTIKKYHFRGLIYCLLISYIFIYIGDSFFSAIGFNDVPILANALGHIPEFSLGVYLAIYSIKRPHLIFGVSVFVFVLSNFSEWFFPFSFITISYIFLYLSYYLYHWISERPKKGIIYIGYLSMHMFIINAALRGIAFNVWWKEMPIRNNEHLMHLAHSCLHFIYVIFIAYLMSILYSKISLVALYKAKHKLK